MWTEQPNIAFGYQWNSYEQMYDSYCNTQIVNLSAERMESGLVSFPYPWKGVWEWD